MYIEDTLDKWMIHIPGRTAWNGARFHHATPNRMQFKAYGLLISEIFH